MHIRRKRCEWVFANPKTLKPFTSFYYSWDTARSQAGLADVRVHDLRHSFASFLVNNGRSLYEVQRILGHTQIKTTQRYAHLDQESLLSAVNTVSAAAPNVLGEGTRPVPIMGGVSAEGSDMAGGGAAQGRGPGGVTTSLVFSRLHSCPRRSAQPEAAKPASLRRFQRGAVRTSAGVALRRIFNLRPLQSRQPRSA